MTSRLLFVGEQFGWNENQKLESDDFARQPCQALLNVAAALKASGAYPAHMVRMTWYVTYRMDYLTSLKALVSVYLEVMGENLPGMTCVEVSELVEVRTG